MKQGIRQIEISVEQRKQNESDYVQYDNDSDFVDVYLDPTTGGLKARHRKHKRTKGKEHFGLKPYELEDEFQNTIVEIGGACILLNEKMKRPMVKPQDVWTHWLMAICLILGLLPNLIPT